MFQLEAPASTIETGTRETTHRHWCELCDRMLPTFAPVGGGSGLCARCAARLALLRDCQAMQIGARIAAVLALRGPLASDLVALRLGQAAAEGRLDARLAAAAGIATGSHPCPVCGMRHRLEAGAARCCAALDGQQLEPSDPAAADQRPDIGDDDLVALAADLVHAFELVELDADLVGAGLADDLQGRA